MIPAFAVFGNMSAAAKAQHEKPALRKRRSLRQARPLAFVADGETTAATADG